MPTPRTTAKKDENRKVALIGVSSSTTTVSGVSFVQGETPVNIAVNPVTNRAIIEITVPE